jgi:hypothetical protein
VLHFKSKGTLPQNHMDPMPQLKSEGKCYGKLLLLKGDQASVLLNPSTD